MKLTLALAFIGIVLLAGFVVSHETTHQEIFKYHGIESEIKYFSGLPSYIATTTAERPCPNRECDLAQNMVDAIGYQLVPLYGIILIGFIFVVLAIEERREEE